MSAVELFNNGEFALDVELHETDGFRVHAPAVARQLGFRDAYRLLESIPDAEKGYTTACTPGGEQRTTYLTEAGFYRALGMRQTARIPDEKVREFVERFQAWVYREVLPALRRGDLVSKSTAFDPAKLSRLEILKLAMQAEEEKAVLEAALESAAPAIAYVDRYVANDDAVLVKVWAAQFGLTDRQARDLLISKNIIYRKLIGQRWSSEKGCAVDEFEYHARADRATFSWFDPRPQHNAPRHHNGQVRTTLYVRQKYALQLAAKVGLTAPSGQIALVEGEAAS